jgi:selenide,water dikinase
VGGHSVDDLEIKLGLAVTGEADPARIMTKGGARPGDALVLTKPIGTGVVSTALKRGKASEEAVGASVASMCTLNDVASAAAVAAGVRCCTDVTGFGLLGHLHEVVIASGVGVEVRFADVPLLPSAREYAEEGLSPGGTERNATHVRATVDGLDPVGEAGSALLFDPQTSGGLLMAVPADRLERLLTDLRAAGVSPAVVGSFVDGPPRIRLRP